MYNVIFHIRLALQYLKYDKKTPEDKKQVLYNILTEALKLAEELK